jgi:hypothetical protein
LLISAKKKLAENMSKSKEFQGFRNHHSQGPGTCVREDFIERGDVTRRRGQLKHWLNLPIIPLRDSGKFAKSAK